MSMGKKQSLINTNFVVPIFLAHGCATTASEFGILTHVNAAIRCAALAPREAAHMTERKLVDVRACALATVDSAKLRLAFPSGEVGGAHAVGIWAAEQSNCFHSQVQTAVGVYSTIWECFSSQTTNDTPVVLESTVRIPLPLLLALDGLAYEAAYVAWVICATLKLGRSDQGAYTYITDLLDAVNQTAAEHLQIALLHGLPQDNQRLKHCLSYY